VAGETRRKSELAEVTMTAKLREIVEELRLVLAGRSSIIDSILPPLIFVIVNALLGFDYAMWGSLLLALLITVLRLRRRQPLWYALGGFAGVAFAILISRLLGRAEGYFLPGIITGGLTVLLCLASVLVGRPIVAWTSYLTRRWPLDWYWHPRVRPAYSEVTWLWVAFFGIRLLVQLNLFQAEDAGTLAVVNALTGWPATIVLLIVSYLYGTWRLGHLRGPSVEEFKSGAEPPWEGQRRGF
jgi:hypothetical protein